jgi:hypothetical protein
MGKNTKQKGKTLRFDSTTLMLLGGIVLIGVAIVVFILFLMGPNGNTGGTPQLQVNTERIELGKQIFNNPVRANFVIKNAGTGTLTLDVPRSATLLEGC